MLGAGEDRVYQRRETLEEDTTARHVSCPLQSPGCHRPLPTPHCIASLTLSSFFLEAGPCHAFTLLFFQSKMFQTCPPIPSPFDTDHVCSSGFLLCAECWGRKTQKQTVRPTRLRLRLLHRLGQRQGRGEADSLFPG